MDIDHSVSIVERTDEAARLRNVLDIFRSSLRSCDNSDAVMTADEMNAKISDLEDKISAYEAETWRLIEEQMAQGSVADERTIMDLR